MEHDRITSLLSRTPAGIPEPDPDFDLLARRARGRRVRRSAGAAVVALVVAVGVALPLVSLLALRGSPHPVGSGQTATPTASGSLPPGVAQGDVAWIECTDDSIDVRTPEVDVQPDGVHLWVSGPSGGEHEIRLTLPSGDRVISFTDYDGRELVIAAAPGAWDASCHDLAHADVTPSSAQITVRDPSHLWADPELPCAAADSQETIALSNETVSSREEVPGAIRDAVDGVLPTDRIETAQYPEQEMMVFRVVRDGSTVALVRYLARNGLPSSDLAFDVTACPDAGFAAPSRSP
jgi:hypothetical protein